MSTSLRVLITGAGSGLGRGLALCLAQQGHAILATDSDLETARETVAQIAAAQHQAEAHALNVTSEREITRLVVSVGRVDVLINNAGLQHVSRVDTYPPARWDRLMDVML